MIIKTAEGAENARLENAAVGTKLQDWKTRERIGYGKPIKPKQMII